MATTCISPDLLHHLQALRSRFTGASVDDAFPLLHLFDTLDPQEMNLYVTERICQPGEMIVSEGEAGDSMYLIRSGQAMVLKGDLQTPKLLGLRGAGGIIGEMALLDNRPRSASVVALETVCLLRLNRENFFLMLGRFPAVSQQLLGVLSARLRQADEERTRETLPTDEQTVQMIQELREQATRDPLTGLYNRRYLEESLVQQVARARRDGSPLSILMIDIDHFKRINDSYGHPAGDKVLQTLAGIIRGSIRAEDVACRYGGEEFCSLRPGASIETAKERAEQMRLAFQATVVAYDQQRICGTLSVGVAAYPLHGSSGEEVLENADRALYTAKQAGRNRVCVC